ncbi:MAG: hypothetical protein KAV00_04605 [Phycisphaerae bacterium]|nr:hypothetical protein [Phycisphaerae bacterium]
MSDKTKSKPTMPAPPYETHDQDLVVVEVVFAKGVREDGRVYRCGETLTIRRGHALAQNTPGRQVYRILATAIYQNGPADQAEELLDEGPLEIS